MACLGAREIFSQRAVGSQLRLLPGRGCSDWPELRVDRRQSGWVVLWERKPGHVSQKEFAKVIGGLVAEVGVELSCLESLLGRRWNMSQL